MSAPTIAETLKFANLQMAAEALYDYDANVTGVTLSPGAKYDGVILDRFLVSGNRHASKFTSTEAAKFAEQWTVVEHISNTTTGFSGTLLKALKNDPSQYIKAGDLVLSFRSTEFLDDHARDNTATNVLEIKEKGFAFGQLSDMEDWYQSLQQRGKITGPLSVTGYSLGGHLATAFNLLHQNELNGGQVVLFNGAGIGKIGTGDNTLAGTQTKLREMIGRFTTLRAQGETTGFLDSFQSEAGRNAYQAIQAHLASTLGVPRAAVGGGFNDALMALANGVRPNSPEDAYAAQRQYDYDLLYEAVARIKAVYEAAHRAPTLSSGAPGGPETGPPNPANVQDLYSRPDGSLALAIAGESIDYQLAVLHTQKEYSTSALGPTDSLAAARGTPTPGAGGPLSNQWDIVGSETTTPPWYGVAYSQYRYGNDFKLFIEDQPITRGDFLGATLTELFQGNIQLLHPNYALNDFGDTHSLVLIVDSLNVQNTLLQLVPEGQRATATQTLDTVLKNASWRKAQPDSAQGKAEGDVLESVVNALADLILGPQAKAQRLNGSPDGNTWAVVNTTDFQAAGLPYTGRDAFYAKLKAITDTDAYKTTLAGKLTLTPSTIDLAGTARNDYFAYAALASLSPFVFKPVSSIDDTSMTTAFGASYTAWQADRDAVASGRTASTISDQWIADRVAMLAFKNDFNMRNIEPYKPDLTEGAGDNVTPKIAPIYFEDMVSGYKIQQGRLDGGTAKRFIFGDDTANTDITGGRYDDRLYGNAGNDTLTGDAGNDYLEGGAGIDVLNGGEDADTLYGGRDDDILDGGAGEDTYIINDGDGKDRVRGEDSGRNRILHNGKLIAGAFVQDVAGGAYRFVGEGNFEMQFNSPGVLTFDQNTSLTFDDYVSAEALNAANFGLRLIDAAVTNGLDLKGDLAPTTSPVRYDTLGNVEVDPARAMLNRADTLNGSIGNDRIEGLGGADIVNGFAGNDLLAGGAGADILVGGLGEDRLYAGVQATLDANATQLNEGAELLAGGGGDDLMVGSGGNDLLLGGEGRDVLIGGSGADNLLGDVDADQISRTWSATRTLIPQGGSVDYQLNYSNMATSDAQGADDVLYGGAGDDWLRGGGGNDILDGGADADILFGEAGNDTLLGGSGNDILNGDGGTQQGDDWLAGGAGDDTLYGMGGQDSLYGEAGTDLIAGGEGNDSLDGGTGDDDLYGEAGNDILLGGAGSDTLAGGEDNDTLDGGADADALNGGAGDDTYLVTSGQAPQNSAVENITDTSGTDTVRLQGFDTTTLKASAINGRDLLLKDNANRVVIIDGLNGAIERFELNGETLGYTQMIGRFAAGPLQGTNAEGRRWQYGGKGNDNLSSLVGNAILGGGGGNDTLTADGNNNTIVYGRGEGTDRVLTGGVGNVLRLGPGITAADLTLKLGSLAIQVGGDANDTIHFDSFDANAVQARKPFDQVEFDDGTTLSYEDLLARGFDLTGTAGNDTLAGTNVNDRISGGTGNDTLSGGAGDDRYSFALGDGQDKIIDTAGTDTVSFGPGLNAADLTVAQRTDAGGRWLDLGFAGGDKISIKDGDRGVIERFEFDGGSVLSTENLLDRLAVRDLLGTAGNDILLGGAGDDTLDGAGGDDLLRGQGGNDRYRLGSGLGNDVIEDTGANTLVLDGGIRFDALSATRQGDDLVLAQRGVSGSTRLAGYFQDGTPWTVVAADAQTTDTDTLVVATTARASDMVASLRANFESDLRNGFTQTMAATGFAALADGSYVRHTTAGAYAYYNSTQQTLRTDYTSRSTGELVQRYSESYSSTRWTKGPFTSYGIPQSWGPAVIADESARLVRNAVTSDDANIVATSNPVTSNPFNAYYSYDTVIGAIAGTNGLGSPSLGYWNQASTAFNFTTAEMTWAVTGSQSSTQSTSRTHFTSPWLTGRETSTVQSLTQTLKGSVLGVAPGVTPTDGSQAFPRYVNAMAFTQSLQKNYAVVSAGDGDNVIDGGELVDAGGGNDTVLVRAAAFVDGGAGDDTITSLTNQGGILFGNAGNDTVTGGGGDDTLIGGAGTDTLNGGYGNDTYRLLDSEDSIDWIEDSGGQDSVAFGIGVRADTLALGGGTDHGYLELTQANGTGVRLHIGALGAPDVETVAFDDGSTVATAQLLAARDEDHIVGTDAAEVFHVGYGNDSVYSGGGNDLLDGGAGDDMLAGEAGDDTLKGGAGNDTYLFAGGDGNDTIDSSDAAYVDKDVLRFGAGIAAADIQMVRKGDDLLMSLSTGDTLTLKDWWAVGAVHLSRVDFAADPSWDAGTLNTLAAQAPIVGGDAGDQLKGTAGNDVLLGLAGDDTLDGGDGNDILTGGSGDDILRDGLGSDIIRFGVGDGHDTLELTGAVWPHWNSDVLQLGAGIDATAVRVTREGFDLVMDFGSIGDRVTVRNWWNNGARIGSVQFADGTAWSGQDLENRIEKLGSEGDDWITGSAESNFLTGLGGEDRLFGGAGNDTMLGGAGDDTLFGDDGEDTLEGGTGNDVLHGGTGNDVFVFGRDDGMDFIDQGGAAPNTDQDVLRFKSGIAPGDVQVSRIGDDLQLLVSADGGRVGMHWWQADAVRLARVEFADGTVWDADTLIEVASPGAPGDPEDPPLELVNIQRGGDGNDALAGSAGKDDLAGGLGDDQLAGGAGDDVYRFDSGDGHDTIDQSSAAAADVDVLQFGPGIRAEDVTVSRDGNDLLLRFAGETDQVTLRDWWGGAGPRIASVVFADHTVWRREDLFAKLPEMPSDGITIEQREHFGSVLQYIRGSDGADVIISDNTGPDFIYGNGGNDILRASASGWYDVLDGGTGNDVYVWNLGDTVAQIEQASAGDNDVDVLRFGPGVHADSISFRFVTVFDDSGTNSFANQRFVTIWSDYEGHIAQVMDWSKPTVRSLSSIEFADGTTFDREDIESRVRVGIYNGSENSGNYIIGDNEAQGFFYGSVHGDDTLIGGTGDDYLNGQGGNDTLFGEAGYDVFNGEAGDDTLDPGVGGGYLTGGAGSDTYLFNRGDGTVWIDQSGTAAGDADVLRFGPDITSADIVAKRVHGLNPPGWGGAFPDDLGLTFKGSDDLVLLKNWWEPDTVRVARIEFADGTIWTTADIEAAMSPAGDDRMLGDDAASDRLNGGAGNDSLAGGGGNDVLGGGTGNDFIDGGTDDDTLDGGAGNDVLVAGSGNNSLAGGEGDDTFVVDASAGVDHISDTGGVDTLVLEGATPGDISLGVGSLKIVVNSTGREIHIDDFDAENPLGSGGVEYFRFADGSVLDKQELIAALGFHPTGGNGNDTLNGTALNDRLSGNGGDDILRGGHGDDLLEGSDGADVYQFNLGDGFDTIDDAPDSIGNRIVFGVGTTRDSIVLATNGPDLLIAYSAGDAVLVSYGAPSQPEGAVISRIDFADGTSASIQELMNQAPVAVPLRDVAIPEGSGVSVFAAAGFFDADGDTLVYSAGQADGAALPAWLSFDATSGLLSGLAQGGDVGNVSVAMTATDPFGRSATQTFRITVESVNDAPIPTEALAAQSVLEDTAFSYQLPADAFIERDVGDVLALSARLASGAPLPTWLSFDAATGTFSGVPANADVGELTIEVTATDLVGASTSQNMALTIVNTNDAPTQVVAIGDAVAVQDVLFQIDLPTGAFRDVDANDVLNYSGVLSNGSPLPGWLYLDAVTGSLSGTPRNGDVGAIGVIITAIDNSGTSASQQFGLMVVDTNDAPLATDTLSNQIAHPGSAFAWSLPTNLFMDVDAGDSLTLSLALSDGAALPGWLAFDPATGVVSGIPASGDVGTLSLSLLATDSAGEVAQINVDLTVASPNQTLTGTDGNDSLLGAAGDDTLSGGLGADWLSGGAGNDSFQLSADGAWVSGYVVRNDGSPGHAGSGRTVSITGRVKSFDAMDGGAGSDLLLGTAGNDVIVLDDAYSPSPNGLQPRFSAIERIDAGDGNDVVDLTSSRWGYGDVAVDGGNGDDVLWTSGGNDSLSGGAGNDTLDGGWGGDTMVGGLDNDTYVVDDAADVVVENAAEGTDTVQSTITCALGADLENLTLLGSAAINGTGNDSNNVLTGNAAANTLMGGIGNDSLNGAAGADILIGGLGDDTYTVDNLADAVVELSGEGTDLVNASVAYVLASNVERLTLTGTLAIDGTGNELNNLLTGNAAPNVLSGGAGNDALNGGAGADTLIGGLGNDSYTVDNMADAVVERADEGVDLVNASLSHALADNVENLTLTGAAAINAIGNAMDNLLTGNSAINILSGGLGNDWLDGKAGADTLIGGAGDDVYVVDNAGDVVVEVAGEGVDRVQASLSHTLAAEVENLTLTGTASISGTGNALDNVITGTSGNNTLTGDAGNDTLDGKAGTDVLVGGSGNDTYVFGAGYGRDTIRENDSTAGNSDAARFLAGIAADQIWLRHVGNHLEAGIIGTTDKLTLENWYLGSSYHVEQFQTADGKQLLDSRVENLVQAMAAFAPPAAGQTSLPPTYQDTLAPVIAANWQ
jgi:Ca2+-binding RTX toxin-like protein